MRNYMILVVSILVLIGCEASSQTTEGPTDTTPSPTINFSNVDLYLTKSDESELFQHHKNSVPNYSENINFSIKVDPEITYQEIDGFGFALTGGSALHLSNMTSSKRAELLLELFSVNTIGISYLRISIGASDLDAEPFTYNDLSNGETDWNLDKFSLEKDQENLIPMLKEILEINPEIKILGSPWSAPSWMKTNNSPINGSLKPECYAVYADYFVKFIEGYEAEGITIDAITIQNEPKHGGNNPSMYMESQDQADFIKRSLGPAFETSNIQTKIIVWDHNADEYKYPISIFEDAEASKYVDGSAFHLYGGSIDDLSIVHNAYPDKNLYFTEQWVGVFSDFKYNLVWHTTELIVGATRNWCKNVLEWNLVSNSELEPHTPGGCTQCLGGITIDGDLVKRNAGYYIIAHASKFVRPGSFRISSSKSTDLPNVAFKTPKGEMVVIVVNNTEINKSFNILVSDEPVTASLDAGSVGTYVWK